MTKASYQLYIAKDFGAPRLIRFDNKFDGANHTIYFTPHGLYWVNKNDPADRVLIKATQSITGVLSNSPNHTITYPNAFGNDVDFVIELRGHGFRKYVRFNSKPALSPPSADYIPVLLHKYESTGLKLRANDSGTDWDDNSYYDSQEGFILTETVANYKTCLRKAHIWDSSVVSRRQKLKVYWEKRDDVLWLAKVLPKTFLANAVYPVFADTTTDYYVDGNAGDGYCLYDDATFNTAHDAAAAESAVDDGDAEAIGANVELWAGVYYIKRGYIPFDTSGLPDNASISAATLYLTLHSHGDTDEDGDNYVTVVQTNQAGVDALVVGDYDECGESSGSGWSNAFQTDIIEGIDAGNRLTLDDGIANGTTYSWVLNATGRGWISKTGWTKLGIREGHDMTKNAVENNGNWALFRGTEYANQASDPKLTVTYTIPGGVAPTGALSGPLVGSLGGPI